MNASFALRRGIQAVGLAIPVIAVALLTSGPTYSSGDAQATAEHELAEVSATDCTVVADVSLVPDLREHVTKAAAKVAGADKWIETNAIWLGSIQGVASQTGGRIVSGDDTSQWVLVDDGPRPHIQQFVNLALPDGREAWVRADSVTAVPLEECTNPPVDF